MGTSSSSKGPKGGVPFDPPWLDTTVSDIDGGAVSPPAVNPDLIVFAPSHRFTKARRNFGAYIRRGNLGSLQKAMGHYVRHGMGGATQATRRMRVVTAVGARMFSLFTATQGAGQLHFSTHIKSLLASPHTPHDVISAIVDFVVPTSGSIDEETCRNAMTEALSDLFSDNPDVDILNLLEADIWNLLELFTEKAISRQVILDIGQILESDGISIEARIQREEEIARFIQGVVATSFHQVRERTSNISQSDIKNIIQEAISTTFTVFGEYDE